MLNHFIILLSGDVCKKSYSILKSPNNTVTSPIAECIIKLDLSKNYQIIIVGKILFYL